MNGRRLIRASIGVMMLRNVVVVIVFAVGFWQLDVSAAVLPLDHLSHDGPSTPEQISLYLPVTGALDAAAKATVRYRPSTHSSWIEAHPLHRIRVANAAAGTPSADAFAGIITGLEPGGSYTVEVSVELDGSVVTRSLTAVTRSLPPSAGKASKIVPPGSTLTRIQAAFDQLQPGDVIQFSDGIYTVDDLLIRRSGAPSKPIYVRGESRTRVILRSALGGNVLRLLAASDVIIENLTVEGSKFDSDTAAKSRGIVFWSDPKATQRRVTIRQLTIDGVDMGIVASGNTEQLLIYDNTLIGNNRWEKEFLESNRTWNDDGIRAPGQGNAVFNNTLIGFGDSLAVHDGVQNVGIHFYRNEIISSGDDAFEGDYGVRNISFYDNRIHNAMTLASFDPIYGGPAFVFRNIAINLGRSPYKLNNRNTGHFLYNNTVVRTNGVRSGAGWGWNQSNNGPLVAWGYRNNILIYRGIGNLMAMESGGQNPIDFTHNAWYPDKAVWWTTSGGSFPSMSAARSRLPATEAMHGKSRQRHDSDLITTANPFVEDIKLGENYLTQITRLYVPTLSDGAAPRGKGVPIPGVTDGFSGSAPDIGALISGRPIPTWGDRSKESLIR
jgi:hypothetical protein